MGSFSFYGYVSASVAVVLTAEQRASGSKLLTFTSSSVG
ncbi:hypothetical protein AVDCRST_MAG94-4088 [uncultured Leptolyngbya sp.]|uniref:Uncharacterized protein n=1 Tax=uncultured Leptolyngbya sp. TaxID=332963 RepID=A0A6J4MYU1_9CYAN|nr:hypothetical protein AVDCRST_MAG94-4088 [uncultured Leptolyngbya sp.]